MSRLSARPGRRRLQVMFLIASATVVLSLLGGVHRANAGMTLESEGGVTSSGALPVVVVVGVPGLRWSDISLSATPNLWDAIDRSSVGELSVRSARSFTCAGDGWVQLGTGNRAKLPVPDTADTQGQPKPVCPTLPEVSARANGATVLGWSDIVRGNAELNYGAVPGALGQQIHAAGGCVSAVGPGAALAGADASGSIDRYAPNVSSWRLDRLPWCALTVVAVDPLVELGRTKDALAAVDQIVGSIDRARPEGSLLMVVGLADLADERAQLHVGLAQGPEFVGGELISGSTRRAPYVQLSDVGPTVLTQLGLSIAPSMTYQAWESVPGNRAPTTEAEVARLQDLEDHALLQASFTPPFFLMLVLSQVVLYLLAYGVLRRLPRGTSRTGVLRATHILAVAFAAGPICTYLANLYPWWRSGHPLAVLVLSVSVAGMTLTLIAFGGPWRRHPFGPAGAVCALTAVLLGVDIAIGAPLQISSLAGYSPIVAGRFAGFGNLAYAVFGAAALLAAAAASSDRSNPKRTAIIAAAGVTAVLVDGAPQLGSDFGGVIALVPAFAVLWLTAVGKRVSWLRLIVVLGAGVLVVAGFAVVDYLRPVAERTHLGRFVEDLLRGDAGAVIQRKVGANLSLLTHSVLTLLVPLAIIFVIFLLRRPRGLLPWTFHHVPMLRAGLFATLVMGIVGGLVNDSGIAVPAMAATLAIPVAIAVVARTMELHGGSAWPAEPIPQPPGTEPTESTPSNGDSPAPTPGVADRISPTP